MAELAKAMAELVRYKKKRPVRIDWNAAWREFHAADARGVVCYRLLQREVMRQVRGQGRRASEK